jgi:hypothetical protein
MQSMNQNHEEIICEIKKLRDGLKPPMPSAYDRAMQVLEKLFIPIAIAILAWTGTQAATRISEGQLHLAETSAKNQQEETKRAMQAKYIEIIYKEINSGSENNQMNAIRLVRLFDTELAQNLLSLVAATPGISKAVAIKADETRRQVESLIPLNGYKVGIYFPSNDPPSIPRVLEI